MLSGSEGPFGDPLQEAMERNFVPVLLGEGFDFRTLRIALRRWPVVPIPNRGISIEHMRRAMPQSAHDPQAEFHPQRAKLEKSAANAVFGAVSKSLILKFSNRLRKTDILTRADCGQSISADCSNSSARAATRLRQPPFVRGFRRTVVADRRARHCKIAGSMANKGCSAADRLQIMHASG